MGCGSTAAFRYSLSFLFFPLTFVSFLSFFFFFFLHAVTSINTTSALPMPGQWTSASMGQHHHRRHLSCSSFLSLAVSSPLSPLPSSPLSSLSPLPLPSPFLSYLQFWFLLGLPANQLTSTRPHMATTNHALNNISFYFVLFYSILFYFILFYTIHISLSKLTRTSICTIKYLLF